MMPVVERYHEILEYRIEGLRKYHARLVSEIDAPPFALSFPAVRRRASSLNSVRIAGLHVTDNPPILKYLRKEAARARSPLAIAELGPGKGTMAGALRERYGANIRAYYGIERDAAIDGPYVKVSGVDGIDGSIDLFIASEVIEHMPFAEFFDALLPRIVSKMTPSATAVVGTPNALSPSSIFGDFSHVQGYAWYDLYALLRLYFADVDIVRTRYVWSGKRLAALLPRIALCKALELDWCEGLVAVARSPRP